MSKTTITKQEYYQVLGLLTLAKEYNKRLIDMEQSLINITGEDTEPWGVGHCAEAIYDKDPVSKIDRLFTNLNIEVLDE